MPLNKSLKKVMVIGSGPIVIGQAAEFDYAGTQACRALKEAGLNVVLVNSNPATIMTDNSMADEIYLEPLNLTTMKRIIEKEKPDSLLSTLGGQTGLTLSMQLAKEGFLDKYNVQLLGANPETIDKAEDRQLFKDTMIEIGQPVIPSLVVTDVESAVKFADEIGYPVIIRPAFTLGGTGGGIVDNEEELREITSAFFVALIMRLLLPMPFLFLQVLFLTSPFLSVLHGVLCLPLCFFLLHYHLRLCKPLSISFINLSKSLSYSESCITLYFSNSLSANSFAIAAVTFPLS